MKYKLILADPPWQYRNSQNGAAGKHYGLMSTDDLCALPVPDLADDDSVLLLWSTNPCLPEALKVMEAWGFQYKTKLVWIKVCDHQEGVPLEKVKLSYGTGYWCRGNAEDILIGVRGKPPAPRSLYLGLISNRFWHSRKPESIHHYAESISQGPYLEMFARCRRPHWDSWGDEVESTIDINDHGNPKNNPPSSTRRWLGLDQESRQSETQSSGEVGS
ncbi:MT-A70 family methyltransferase [Synechococcus elongatus]|uniref:MT-A70 family methyltransferase n=1 Tax=Synechococcus elongatus TaxID=32046 RepID=UPI000F7DADE9|nr:MT-A70 family methyltransferase [Synechococcus elongatus]